MARSQGTSIRSLGIRTGETVNGTNVRASEPWASTSRGRRPARNMMRVSKDGGETWTWVRIERTRNGHKRRRTTTAHAETRQQQDARLLASMGNQSDYD